MQDILFSLGIISGVSQMKKYTQKSIVGHDIMVVKDKYHLRVAKIDTAKICEWDTEDLKLKRFNLTGIEEEKRVRRVWFSDDLEYIYFKVASVETEEYIGYVYNFECFTHTFMCNWIPTHNCDPFDDDEAHTMSLGSFHIIDFWTDRLVGEYTGRPMFANDFYEKVRLACIFYNCKAMYEQNLKGIFGYFSSRNCTHLLADTPDFLKDKQLISSIGVGNKAKGIRATVPIIKYGFKLLRDWLLKPVTKIETDEQGDEHEVTIPNLYLIRNRALLKELILWNPFGNYDRIMAMVQLMLYREEKIVLFQGDMKRSEKKATGVAADEYWSKNYPGIQSQRWQ
jgi:hypothetical protein